MFIKNNPGWENHLKNPPLWAKFAKSKMTATKLKQIYIFVHQRIMHLWSTLLKAAQLENYAPILNIAAKIPSGEVPFIHYHRQCRCRRTARYRGWSRKKGYPKFYFIAIVARAINLFTWWIVRITINDSRFKQNIPQCVSTLNFSW